MKYEVNLIRVPVSLTADQRTELADNCCRHLEGRWWIFEGDVCALRTPSEVYAVGITTGLHPDDIPDGLPIIEHAVDIFRLSCWPPTREPTWFDTLDLPIHPMADNAEAYDGCAVVITKADLRLLVALANTVEDVTEEEAAALNRARFRANPS